MLDEVEPDGVFSGYASLFGAVDLGKDVVEKGAFAASLKTRGAAGIRMLFQHDPAEPIGVWTEIREDARGLFVRGRLTKEVARAREVLSLMRGGALDGLSIGFRAVRAKNDPKSGVRRILEADLWEISVVTFPMLPDARIDTVKGRHRQAAAADDTRIRKLAHAGRGADARRGPVRDRQGFRQPGARAGCRAEYGRGPRRTYPRGDTHDDENKNVGNDTMTEQNLARAPETKSTGSHPELADAFDEFMTTFEAFKDSNDRRLAELESKGADVLTVEKVDRISQGAGRAEARHRQSVAEGDPAGARP